ncbi:carboxypeptidase regulatory-like domain-containing protein [Persicitalea sp.]|uniref:TonB-dependent receptor n=1 Tax=Persicitalea sp. TaxID=3100273 RepID=UPI0035941C24
MNRKGLLFKSVGLTLLAFVLTFMSAQAQVTSSAITGRVADDKNEGLPGATVVATHLPSGSQYGTVTNESGRYTIPSVRVGGPYKVTVSYVGYNEQVQNDIFANLGTSANVSFRMQDEGTQLQEVQVVSRRSDVFSSERTGAATTVTSEQLKALPTISRSLNDFTRLTPQSNGNSFGGRDGRYNNITIDGANFNNNFGLSSSNLPGGSAQPLSLDAIEEVQVNIAPYDVRQANFTGAGINVVTKSGTNQVKGTAYTYFRNEKYNGTKVGDVELPAADKTNNQIIGGTIGAPLIKNKLFIFVNGEYEKNVRPGFNFVASRPGATGSNVSRTTAADLEAVSNFARSEYGYETGPYEGYASNFTQQNFKILARLDWNISNNHKFNVRYSDVKNTDDNIINGRSAPNPRASSNRVSQNALTYENSNYGFQNSVRSIAAELNSTFNGRFSNQFLATYTFIEDTRTSKSSDFPFVDIWKDKDNYISLGYELFSYNNNVKNTVFNVIDNFTYYAGKHTILGGVSYEQMYFANSFLRYGTSYYRFNSVEDFLAKKLPTAYAYTYSLQPGVSAPASDLTFGQASAYLQDEFSVSPKLKLTAGVRVDMPVYPVAPIENPAVTKLSFKNGEKITTGQWPTSKPAISPRVGFNFSETEKGFQIRGGTGVFNGRIPFVWFTNQPTNSGVIQNTFEETRTAELVKYPFSPNPTAHLDKLPQNAGQSAPSSLASVDPDFRMPQIWRTNLAIDKKLPGDASLTLEAIYSKELVTVYQRNINYNDPVSTLKGADNRPLYTSATRRVVPSISEAMVLDNTSGGGGLSLTAEAKKRFNRGLFTSLAYTFNNVKDLTGNPGSQAASAWSNNVAVGSLNDLPLAYSDYAVPHRVVGAISYRLDYLDHLATTFSLFYEGQSQGRYSYVYNGDVNSDGLNSDLLYIPSGPSEILFEDVINTDKTIKYTAQQQSDAFFKYVEQDPYLSKNKGKYAERNGALAPWFNRIDFRVLQDFYLNVGGKRNTLQFGLDVLNLPNLLKSSWGIRQRTAVNNAAILQYRSLKDGQPVFRLSEAGGALPTNTFENIPSASTTWGAQASIRYIFN